MKKRDLLLIFATLLMSGFVLVAYQNLSVSDNKVNQIINDPNPAFETNNENPGNAGKSLPGIENKEAWADTPLSFENYQEMMQYHSQLGVAGYGTSTGGFGEITPLGQFTFFSTQIPGQQKFLVFVYGRKQEPTSYVFVDNFIMAGNYPPMLTFMSEGDDLIYIHELTRETIKRKKIDMK